MNTDEHWRDAGDAYLSWTRTPGLDVGYWNHNRPALLALLPEPRTLTLDVGCGEGRMARELITRGHRVIGIELAARLAKAAYDHPEGIDVAVGDLRALPLADRSADLAVASMVLMDLNRLDEAVLEVARVLRNGGRFCFSILHPINTAGAFTHRDDTAAPFVIDDDYYESRHRSVAFERDGVAMVFVHEHRPLEAYFGALERAGFVVEAVREPRVGDHVAPSNPNWQRWTRLPNTMHVRARLERATGSAALGPCDGHRSEDAPRSYTDETTAG